MALRMPKFKLRIRTLLVLVAFSALLLWVCLTVWNPTGRLIRQLRADQPAYLRREAAVALGYNIPSWKTEQAIAALIVALRDQSPRVRESATAGLAGHGALSSRAIPKLIALLKDADGGVRYAAASCLGTVAGQASRKQAVAGLEIALADTRRDVREVAVESLIKLGEARSVSNTLAGLLKEGTADDRRRILRGLGRWIGPSDRAIIPALITATQDESMSNQLEAANLLILLGRADAATPVLDRASRHDDPVIRGWAAQIRSKITPPADE